MIRLVRLFGTSIGQKLVVALSGAALLGFLIGHMLGNMTLFQGPDTLNGYASWLQGHPLLWLFRIGLIGLFVVHIVGTVNLVTANNRARSAEFRPAIIRRGGLISRYMVVTGSLVLIFVGFHLMHFTFGVVQPEHHLLRDEFQRPDVYSMVVNSFQSPWITLTYVGAIMLLGVHLIHGAASLFQTLGINHESYEMVIRYGCYVVVGLVVAGLSAIPLLVFFGAVAPKVGL